MVKKYSIAVDPGISGTGVAIFQIKPQLVKPIGAFNVYPSALPIQEKHKITWMHNASSCFSHFKTEVSSWMEKKGLYLGIIEVVWCEVPTVFDSAISLAAAKTDSITKMAFFCGLIAAHTWSRLGGTFCPVEVLEWKGQLPKKIVADRIEKIIGPHPYKSHAIDAIGIGLHKMGVFK